MAVFHKFVLVPAEASMRRYGLWVLEGHWTEIATVLQIRSQLSVK